MAHQRLGIYIVYDEVADQFVGGVRLHAADASAVREFKDAATMEGSIVKQHLADFQLIALGSISEDNHVVPNKRVVITGKHLMMTDVIQGDQLNLIKEG